MLTGKKSFGEFLANVWVGACLGAMGFGVIGSGLEDLLLNQSNLTSQAKQSIDYLSLYATAGGGIFGGLLQGFLYFNRDEFPGKVVLVSASEEPKEEPQPLDKNDLSDIVSYAASGVANRGLANQLYSLALGSLNQSPLDSLRRQYEMNRNGFLVNQFEVFVPFEFDGIEISPREVLDELFDVGDQIYSQVRNQVLSYSSQNISGQEPKLIHGVEDTKQNLQRATELATQTALWVTYLSKREGLVGNKVRAELRKFGVTNPNYLPSDINKVGRNIQTLYGIFASS